MSNLVYRNVTEADKRQICAWKYEGKYEIYNLPSYEVMRERQSGFMNPKSEKNYYAFLDENVLVGFVNLVERETEIYIGIGVSPVFCGKHYGPKILMCACEISKALYPDKPLYLEVRTWNTRAIKCYEKAGFKIDGEPYELTTAIGNGTFYRMTKESLQCQTAN